MTSNETSIGVSGFWLQPTWPQYRKIINGEEKCLDGTETAGTEVVKYEHSESYKKWVDDLDNGMEATRLLADLVRAYDREVNPSSDWTQTALTEDEFSTATKEYRAAKAFLSANDKLTDRCPAVSVERKHD